MTTGRVSTSGEGIFLPYYTSTKPRNNINRKREDSKECSLLIGYCI